MTRIAVFAYAAVLVAGAALCAADAPAESQRRTPARSEPVACAASGLDATVTLAYDYVTIGHISATYVALGFAPLLSLPGETQKLRDRTTSLLPQGIRVGPPTVDGNRLRVPLATALQAIPPGKVFKVRFDCPAGSRVDPGALSCQTAEVTGASGEPLQESLARDVRCAVELEPAAR